MKYQITYKEIAQNFRANQWLDVEDELNRLECWLAVHPDTADEFSFSLEGKVVSLAEISNAVSQAREAFYAKRAETKKPIRISQGATNLPNTYITVWVKK